MKVDEANTISNFNEFLNLLTDVGQNNKRS